MKKIHQVVFIIFINASNLMAQNMSLGFKDDINGGYFRVNYNNLIVVDSTKKVSSNSGDIFNCGTFRFGGALIARRWLEKEPKFSISDYWQLGLGVGIGHEYKDSAGVYIKGQSTFAAIFGANLGVALRYRINDDFVAGVKFIVLGGDYFFDYNHYPIYANGTSIHPTIQFKNFYLSGGMGKRTTKNNHKITSLDFEFRLVLKDYYIGARYQNAGWKNEKNENSNNIESRMVKQMGVMFGVYL